MKTFHILQTVRRVPAGLMFVPLVLGALLNTFVPQALESARRFPRFSLPKEPCA